MDKILENCRSPGQLIEEALKAKGWTQRVLSIVLGMDETGVNKIIGDKRPVTADMALMLEEVLGISAERFMELQQTYDLAKARITARPDPKRATRAHLFGGLPVTEMIKRGWLNVDNIKDVPAIETELARFFKASTIDDIEVLPHAAKKTEVVGGVTDVQLAWLYRVRRIASELIVAKYSQLSALSCIKKLSGLLYSREEARKVPKILAEAGIRFVIVESLPSAKIDGVCFWLNENSPVIGMAMRYDRIDNFWFVLRHELEHVIQRHGQDKAVLDTELEGANAGVGAEIPEEERIANRAAADFCVPSKMMKAFVDRKSPYFSEQDILAFSSMTKVHPGLIVGQIRHITGRYNLFANHLVKIRSVVTPNAAVDGWGDVYPVED